MGTLQYKDIHSYSGNISFRSGMWTLCWQCRCDIDIYSEGIGICITTASKSFSTPPSNDDCSPKWHISKTRIYVFILKYNMDNFQYEDISSPKRWVLVKFPKFSNGLFSRILPISYHASSTMIIAKFIGIMGSLVLKDM